MPSASRASDDGEPVGAVCQQSGRRLRRRPSIAERGEPQLAGLAGQAPRSSSRKAARSVERHSGGPTARLRARPASGWPSALRSSVTASRCAWPGRRPRSPRGRPGQDRPLGLRQRGQVDTRLVPAGRTASPIWLAGRVQGGRSHHPATHRRGAGGSPVSRSNSSASTHPRSSTTRWSNRAGRPGPARREHRVDVEHLPAADGLAPARLPQHVAVARGAAATAPPAQPQPHRPRLARLDGRLGDR